LKNAILLALFCLSPAAESQVSGILDPSSAFSSITMENSSWVEFTLQEVGSSVVAVDVSSNLVDWLEFARITPESSPSAHVLEEMTTGVAQHFFRAVSNPPELQVSVHGDFPLPAGTSVSASPGNVHLDVGQGFDSRTFPIGTRFLSATGYVSIVAEAPGYISQTQTVSAVGIRNGAHVSFSFTEAHSLAPTSLAGLSFDYGFNGTGTIIFSNNGLSYLWLLPNGTSEAGTYVTNRAGSVWSINLINPSGTTTASLRFQFTAGDAGTLSITYSGVLDGATEPFARSTRIIDANLLAPATINSISVHTEPSSLIGEESFTAIFSGGFFTYTSGAVLACPGRSNTRSPDQTPRIWFCVTARLSPATSMT
jgi:hypothetical protein